MLDRLRTLDHGIRSLAIVLIVLMGVALALVQLGIRHGRNQQKADDAALIAAADARAQRLGDMLAVAQKQLEQMPLVQQLTWCESRHKHKDVWGDGGKSYGRWQFQEASFLFLAERAGLPGLDWKDAQHQTVVGSWAISNGYGRWWTCWRKLVKHRSHEETKR